MRDEEQLKIKVVYEEDCSVLAVEKTNTIFRLVYISLHVIHVGKSEFNRKFRTIMQSCLYKMQNKSFSLIVFFDNQVTRLIYLPTASFPFMLLKSYYFSSSSFFLTFSGFQGHIK